MKRELEEHTLAYVWWGDAWGNSGWQKKETSDVDHAATETFTVGLVKRHDKRGISLSDGYGIDTGNSMGHTFIPAGMIIKIKKIKVKI